jgi:hypothetical protein
LRRLSERDANQPEFKNGRGSVKERSVEGKLDRQRFSQREANGGFARGIQSVSVGSTVFDAVDTNARKISQRERDNCKESQF